MTEDSPTSKPSLHFRTQWLVSAPYDLGFFVFSGLLSFFFWGLYTLLIHFGWQADGMAILITYFLFTSLIDLPHIFQTFSRTHADKTEFQRRKRLYTWGLLLILVAGPLWPLLGIDAWMIGAMALYGSYHIVRQHLGLIRMYHHLNEPERTKDHQLDSWCIQIALLSFVVYDYVELSDEPLTQITVYGNHIGLFPVVPEWLGNATLALGFVALSVIVWRQLSLIQQGQDINLPKLLLMGMALTINFCIFVLASVPFLVAEAIETAYHNLQYQGFIAHYQKQRFTHTKHIVLKWLAASLLYGLVAGCIEVIGYVNGFFYLLFTPLTMLTLFHYYIDGKIWRFSASPELAPLVHKNSSATASSGPTTKPAQT